MVALNLKLILSFIILVCCQTSFAADEAIPDWVSKPPTQDTQYWYFVGRSSGDASEDKLYEQAYENAKITAIRELFGIATEVSSQSYETLNSSTSVSRINESSRKVILKEFRKKEQYRSGSSLWVLYEYPKVSAKAELIRLESNIRDQSVEFSELNATSSKQSGILEIVTSPNDVTVTVDNQSYGIAPLRLKLTEGTHTVMLDNPYYEHIEEQVVVKTGDVTKLNKILARAKRNIIIKTNPEQATVELGGKYLGTSPIETDVVAGERLTVLVTHPETLPLKTEVMIGKGSGTHKLELPPLTLKPSFLSVNSVPQGAEVFIGGKLIGKTPTGLIEAKSGTLEIKKDEYVLYEQFVSIRGGEKRILPTIQLVSISDEEKRLIEAEKRKNNFYGGLFEFGSGPISGKSMSVIAAGAFVEKTIWSNAFGVRGSLSYKYGIGGQKYSAADAYENNLSGLEASVAAPIYLRAFVVSPEGGIFSGTFMKKGPTVTGSIVDTTNLTSESTSLTQSFYGASIGYQYPSWTIYSGYRNYGSSNGLDGAGTVFLGVSFRGNW